MTEKRKTGQERQPCLRQDWRPIPCHPAPLYCSAEAASAPSCPQSGSVAFLSAALCCSGDFGLATEARKTYLEDAVSSTNGNRVSIFKAFFKFLNKVPKVTEQSD